MRQFFAEQTINPCTSNGTQQRNHGYYKAASYLRKQWAWACTCNSPAKTKYQPAVYIAPMEFFCWDDDSFAAKCFKLKTFNDEYGYGTNNYSTPDYAVHVEGLQPEHFLDPEPRNNF